jgi:hypothetical protein
MTLYRTPIAISPLLAQQPAVPPASYHTAISTKRLTIKNWTFNVTADIVWKDDDDSIVVYQCESVINNNGSTQLAVCDVCQLRKPRVRAKRLQDVIIVFIGYQPTATRIAPIVWTAPLPTDITATIDGKYIYRVTSLGNLTFTTRATVPMMNALTPARTAATAAMVAIMDASNKSALARAVKKQERLQRQLATNSKVGRPATATATGSGKRTHNKRPTPPQSSSDDESDNDEPPPSHKKKQQKRSLAPEVAKQSPSKQVPVKLAVAATPASAAATATSADSPPLLPYQPPFNSTPTFPPYPSYPSYPAYPAYPAYPPYQRDNSKLYALLGYFASTVDKL